MPIFRIKIKQIKKKLIHSPDFGFLTRIIRGQEKEANIHSLTILILERRKGTRGAGGGAFTRGDGS